MSQPSDLEKMLGKVIGVLIQEMDGYFKFSNEELEDAPEVEVRKIFSTDEFELRIKNGKN